MLRFKDGRRYVATFIAKLAAAFECFAFVAETLDSVSLTITIIVTTCPCTGQTCSQSGTSRVGRWGSFRCGSLRCGCGACVLFRGLVTKEHQASIEQHMAAFTK